MTSKIGYLGPAGSYAEQATILYNPDAEKVPYPSIPTVAKAVEKVSFDLKEEVDLIRDEIRAELKRFLRSQTAQTPIILPVVMLV